MKFVIAYRTMFPKQIIHHILFQEVEVLWQILFTAVHFQLLS